MDPQQEFTKHKISKSLLENNQIPLGVYWTNDLTWSTEI